MPEGEPLDPALAEYVAAFARELERLSRGEDAGDRLQQVHDEAVQAAYERAIDRGGNADASLGSWSLSAGVADNIRNLRDKSGWTQAQLADAMTEIGFKWKRITVAEVEGDDRRISFEELCGLSALFGVPMVHLLLPSDHVVVDLNETLIRVPGPMLRELMLGRRGHSGRGGATWRAAAAVLRGSSLQGRRPATDLWRAQRDAARIESDD
jgi:transcriptional regulator with XRE-family HTH domain